MRMCKQRPNDTNSSMSSSGKVNVSSHGMSSLFELFKESVVYREQLRAAQWKWSYAGGGGALRY